MRAFPWGFFSPSPPGPAHRCPVAGRRRKQRRRDPRRIPGNWAAIPLGGPGWSRASTITGAPRASASSCSEFPTLDLRLCSSPVRVFFPGNDRDSNPASRALLFGASVAAFSACHLLHLCNCPVPIEFYYSRFSDAG